MTESVSRTPAPGEEVTLVLFHGRSHAPASMLALAERAGFADAPCVAPAAAGGSWYPGRFFAPRAENEPHLSAAIDGVHATIDELERSGVPSGRIVVGGFSQGACLVADAMARRPRPIGALAVICGGLIGAGEELVRPPEDAFGGVPVLVTGVEQDEWVPVDRVRATAGGFGAAGADVTLLVLPPAEHAIHDEEVAAFRSLVDAVRGRRP